MCTFPYCKYGRTDISAEQFCLAPDKTYVVGRYPGPTPDSPDIGNKADNSMSRKHGVVTVERGRRGGRPKVFVEDSGSKFGTYVGEHAIALTGNSSQSQDGRIGRKTEVAEGSRVRFGLASTVFR